MSQLRLGIVGCGDIAQAIGWFGRLNRKIRLAAACDVSAERAAAFARRFNIPRIFTDYAAMLGQAELDAVYLAVPHHLHYGMIATAVAAGMPVFVEKPITRTMGEGKHIVQLAAIQDVKVGVNYQYRYDSGCHRLARAVQNGDLGAVHAVRINVPWHREVSYFDQAAWHGRIATAGGGTLITQASHLLDIVLWAMRDDVPKTAVGYTAQRKFKNRDGDAEFRRGDAEVRRGDAEVRREDAEVRGGDVDVRKGDVQVRGGKGDSAAQAEDLVIEVEDLAQGIVEMESGALIQISSSMVASSEQAVSMEVYGEKGTAVYGSSPLPHVKFRDVKVKAQKPPYRGVHALQRSLEGFRAWIMEDYAYLIPAKEALPALAVVEAIYKSSRTGMREEIS